MSDFCDMCDDGTGHSVFPYYGVAPHTCFYKLGEKMGASQELPDSEWPSNFKFDTSDGRQPNPGGFPGCGTYTHCPHCGSGDR